jgi:hypothetical protein
MLQPSAPADAKPWLSFVNVLIWQVFVAWLLWRYRKQIEGVIDRISGIKVAGWEMTTIQKPSEESRTAAVDATSFRDIPNGEFLSDEDLNALIIGRVARPGQKVRDKLLIWQTNYQRTWLVAADDRLFCVLDTYGNRRASRLIQWEVNRRRAGVIRARETSQSIGKLDIGSHVGWLYSISMHPDPEVLEQSVQSLLQTAVDGSDKANIGVRNTP